MSTSERRMQSQKQTGGIHVKASPFEFVNLLCYPVWMAHATFSGMKFHCMHLIASQLHTCSKASTGSSWNQFNFASVPLLLLF